MNSLDELKNKILELKKFGKDLKALNFVNATAAALPTSGEVFIEAGTVPQPITNGVSNKPYMAYNTSNPSIVISRTALVGNRHFARTDAPTTFAQLESRTSGVNLDSMFDLQKIEIEGDTFTIPVPKVRLRITFSPAGTVYVPAETKGSDILSFKKKDSFAMLSVSQA